MPTPMPIMATAWFENVGMSTTLTTRPTSEMPVTMPKMAVIRGRPMASTDPKAISRMIMAARNPNASLENSLSVRNASPPSSMVVPGTSASSTRAITRSRAAA